MTAIDTHSKPKVYMSERDIKRIFNLPKPAMKALEDWENKNKEHKGHEDEHTQHTDAK